MAELMMLLIATVAQLVEHLIRNERVAGSNPVSSSNYVALPAKRKFS